MANQEERELIACPECFGKTILFYGKGKNTQYRICSRWRESGHLTEKEVKERLHQVKMTINPSGRFA